MPFATNSAADPTGAALIPTKEMNMSRKLVLLAGAMAVMAAVSLPSSANAAWKHHATPIAQNVQFGLTGNIRNQGGLGGMECQVTMRTVLLAGQTTGVAETFVPHPTSDTTNCRGLGGLAFCQIHNFVPQAPNWVFHTTATDVTLTTTNIVYQTTGGFCPTKQTTTTAASLTFTPNQPTTFSSFQVSGTSIADIETTSGTVDQETVQLSGSLSVESPNANTYSI